ncbi:PEP-CTERM sorting domain-containing protein [Methyloversatilis sp.]|uniref:PEP-CTERM sorting domain-containing protein n=1 Tax=Methyloversatilis sp. TaxID=2569862 RepID=UPI003D2D84C0
MNLIKTTLALALASLGMNAQAAHFSLISGSVSGSTNTNINELAASWSFGGTLDDLSGSGYLLGVGGGESSAGSVSHVWSQSLLLDAASDPSNVLIQGSRSMSLDTTQPVQVNSGSDTIYSQMLAAVRIQGDGAADGSAVRVSFSGTIDNIFSSALSTISTPSFLSLIVRGDGNSTIAEYQVATFDSGIFSFAFDSSVGADLRLDIGFGSNASIGMSMAPVGPGNLIESTTLVSGSLTVTPVPEPEQCALLLAGLGLIGAAARRRRG